MLRLLRLSSTITIIFLLSMCSGGKETTTVTPTHKGIPDWVQNRPVIAGYYVGIGSASKSANGTASLTTAQDNALADLATQISVTISSDIMTTLIEKGGLNEDEYSSQVRSQATAELEGHELIDTWEDDRYHYAYYRLNKAEYEAWKQRKRNEAIALSLDLYKEAAILYQSRDIASAFRTMLQAFNPLLPYLHEAIQADIGGNRVYLNNHLYQDTRRMLQGVRIIPNETEIRGKLAAPVYKTLFVTVTNPQKRPVPNFPLNLEFLQGDGDIVPGINSNEKGVANITIARINSAEALQTLEVRADMNRLIPVDADPILKALVSTLEPPSTRITIQVSTPTIWVEATENYEGTPIKQLRAEPVIKNALAWEGFVFADTRESADWHLVLQASALQGANVQGLYTAFADLSISVKDLTSGKELYKNSINRQKGIDLDYEKAAYKALVTAAEKVGENMVPTILEALK